MKTYDKKILKRSEELAFRQSGKSQQRQYYSTTIKPCEKRRIEDTVEWEVNTAVLKNITGDWK